MELIDVFPIPVDKIIGIVTKKSLNIKMNASVYINNEEISFTQKTILEEINLLSLSLNKIKDLMKIFNLDEEFLNLPINSLLPYQNILLKYLLGLSRQFKYLIINEPFLSLNLFHKKKLLKLFRLLIKNNKSVIIISNDNNLLYEITDYIVVIHNNKVVETGLTLEVFKNIKLLKKYNLDIPLLVKFSYLANKKIKLSYHKDIRDLIKDVYKHK